MWHCRNRSLGPASRPRTRDPRHVRRHGPPRTGRRRHLPRRRRRPRHAPPEHHRPRQRPPADLERRRHPSGSSSTARSTTTASCAAISSSAATRFRTDSDTETIVHLYEEYGAALRRPPARHVRVRDLGRAAARSCCSRATASASSRSTTPSATASSLFASELKPILQLPTVSTARSTGRRSATCSRSSRRPPTQSIVDGVSQARARARGDRAPRAGRCSIERYWDVAFEPERERDRGRARRAAARAACTSRSTLAPGQRRAGRRVPQRRHRLERRRRDDGEAGGRPAEDVLDRLRGSRLRRAARTRGTSPRSSAPITTTSCCGPTSSRSSRT